MSPVLIFLFPIFFFLDASFAIPVCHPADHSALLSFRAGLNDPYIGIFKSWTGPNCCDKWNGVTCDPNTGRVADLSLHGELLDRSINIQGRSGLMTGHISPAICQLSRLSSLILADWKQISGTIPVCMGMSLPFLRHLDLVGNQLTGTIPGDFGRLTNLTVLNLADNNLTGSIPGSISYLADLHHLDLSGNQLTGPIPHNFGNLKMLSRALMAKNQLSGLIPTSITRMKRLADLDLSSNRLSGQIPADFGNMLVLSTLNLDNNQFSGRIPDALLASKGLGTLNLSKNSLQGSIPDVFGERSYFMLLDLAYNKLTGNVPTTLVKAAYIGHLDLSHNHLCGRIPGGSPFDHLEAPSFVSNDCLCGAPLAPCR